MNKKVAVKRMPVKSKSKKKVAVKKSKAKPLNPAMPVTGQSYT